MSEGRGSRRAPLVRAVVVDDEVYREVEAEEIRSPARCNTCRLVFDLGKVEVTARFADCSVWKCPGCRAEHDDRQAWHGGPADRHGYTDLTERRREAEHAALFADPETRVLGERRL